MTQGCDQYWVPRAAEQPATTGMLHWLLSVVIRAGVGTVADAVKLSEGHFYPADCRIQERIFFI